jgi:hypothetical protein
MPLQAAAGSGTEVVTFGVPVSDPSPAPVPKVKTKWLKQLPLKDVLGLMDASAKKKCVGPIR